MSNKNISELTKKRKLHSDLLEVAIVLAFIFLIISIYVPRAIWDEEAYFENKSRFYMENMFDVQNFYNSLMEEYDSDGLWVMNVVNSVRDSLTGDSTYLGEQSITLNGNSFTVNVPKGYDIDFDTTFGFPMMRRDTILDTTATIVMFSEDLSRNDTIYIQKKRLNHFQSDSNFVALLDQVGTERVEVVNYYDSYMPDSSMYFCPVTEKPYLISIKDEGNTVRVDSPIEDTVVRNRYAIFAFKAMNHGFIDDGSKSWDR
ncbi:MAG: hypothetical protein ISR82_02275 [Candidatus Marinimicrobia bacterium]|nr:hypothetical protein [Candidatus Neomarinimicrobiota bacterium]MBL7010033.1 hypothetical protein [Candidatus Neomarinimicrobiota bacterium]MBL7030302.1 hypothetical protein [Candidatus Neomarinimicrobiota bacterium]